MSKPNLITIFKAERLKLKHTRNYSLIVLVTLVAPILAYLVGGVTIFVPFTLYWWEALFLFLLNGLLFLGDIKREDGAGNFQNITGTLAKKQIYCAKVLVIFCELFLASLILFGAIYLVAGMYGGLFWSDTIRLLAVILTLLVTSFWNIPFIYYLASRLNVYLIIIGNSLCCLLLAPFVAQTKWWFIFPYTYHYKATEALIALAPNGVPKAGSSSVDLAIWGSALIFSLISAVIFGWLLRREQNV